MCCTLGLGLFFKTPAVEEPVVASDDIKEEAPESEKASPTNKRRPAHLNMCKRQASPVKLPEAKFRVCVGVSQSPLNAMTGFSIPLYRTQVLDDYVKPTKKHVKQTGFYRYIEKSADELDDEVEYDMDDQVA